MNMLSFPLAFGGWVVASPLMKFVYSEASLQAAHSFSILILTFPLVSLREGAIHILNAQDRQKTNFYIDLAGLVFNVIINLILIPAYGFIGAAWATFLSYLLVVLLSFMVVKFEFNLNKLIEVFGKPLVASVLMALLLALVCCPFHVMILVLIGAFTYLIFLWLIKGLRKEEFSFLVDIFPWRKS